MSKVKITCNNNYKFHSYNGYSYHSKGCNKDFFVDINNISPYIINSPCDKLTILVVPCPYCYEIIELSNLTKDQRDKILQTSKDIDPYIQTSILDLQRDKYNIKKLLTTVSEQLENQQKHYTKQLKQPK
ncbi:MAG: hypothetical protein Q4G04_00755 [bacterium]|nr:hypothetical protein [bacterium]